jgi:hypothetical protein
MLAIDLVEGRLYGEDEIIDELAGRTPTTDWLGNMVDLEKPRSRRAPSRASTAARSWSAARPPPA